MVFTKSRIADFVLPSFHEGSGSVSLDKSPALFSTTDEQPATNHNKVTIIKKIVKSKCFIDFIDLYF